MVLNVISPLTTDFNVLYVPTKKKNCKVQSDCLFNKIVFLFNLK
jgi:hypothetical protein